MSKRQWYGSFQNRLSERSKQPAPAVGMGATLCYWSDRVAATVVEISPDGKLLTVQNDTSRLAGGHIQTEQQRYIYAANPQGVKTVFRLDRQGRWREVYRNEETGRMNLVDGGVGLLLGHRDEFKDPTF